MKHVTILAIEHGLASSITIPLEMIQAADVIKRIRNRKAGHRRFLIASRDGKQLTMTCGITIQPQASITDISETDLIFIPALWGNPNAILQRHSERSACQHAQQRAGATICR